MEWKAESRNVERSRVECGKWSVESGWSGELRMESGDWRVERGKWSACSGYHVMCDALNLHKFRAECLHSGSWTPTRL